MASNRVIIDGRDTGKTTFLLKEVSKSVSSGKNVIILDSATDHEDKSLLRKVMKSFPNAVYFDNRDENTVVNCLSKKSFEREFNEFPVKQILSNKGKIICFDLSYFVEMGHERIDNYGDRDGYHHYRSLYRSLAQQIIHSIVQLDYLGKINDTVVIMDEIELPITDFDVTLFQKDVEFLAAVHPENAFGTFYQSCEEISFVPYQKRLVYES